MRCCSKCQQEKPLSEFYKKLNDLAKHCKTCAKAWAKTHPYDKEKAKISAKKVRESEKHKEYRKKWYEKNPDKKYYLTRDLKKKTVSEARYRAKNKEKIRAYHKARRIMLKTNSPAKFLLEKLSGSVRKLSRGKASISAAELCSVSSVEEFFSIINQKCDNPNWLNENYQVDHIWQVHWFRDFALNCLSEDQVVEVVKLINRTENLRPLPFLENNRRSFLDFCPLLEEDLPKYEPFLNKDILEKIKYFFAHREDFPKERIYQGDELDRFLRYLTV